MQFLYFRTLWTFFLSLCNHRVESPPSTVALKRSLEPPMFSCFQRIVRFDSLCLSRSLDLRVMCVSHILPSSRPLHGPMSPFSPPQETRANERDLKTPTQAPPPELQAPESHTLKDFISAVYLERGVENQHVGLFNKLINVVLLNKTNGLTLWR